LKISIDSLEVSLEYKEFVGLDEDSRAKAMKKKEKANKKIAIKNLEAVNKALQRNTKKTAIIIEKEKLPLIRRI